MKKNNSKNPKIFKYHELNSHALSRFHAKHDTQTNFLALSFTSPQFLTSKHNLSRKPKLRLTFSGRGAVLPSSSAPVPLSALRPPPLSYSSIFLLAIPSSFLKTQASSSCFSFLYGFVSGNLTIFSLSSTIAFFFILLLTSAVLLLRVCTVNLTGFGFWWLRSSEFCVFGYAVQASNVGRQWRQWSMKLVVVEEGFMKVLESFDREREGCREIKVKIGVWWEILYFGDLWKETERKGFVTEGTGEIVICVFDVRDANVIYFFIFENFWEFCFFDFWNSKFIFIFYYYIFFTTWGGNESLNSNQSSACPLLFQNEVQNSAFKI